MSVGIKCIPSVFEYADNIHNLLWIQRFKVCYPWDTR
nr:MAG TPA: venom protein-like protein [Caudoviricetes sp.]